MVVRAAGASNRLLCLCHNNHGAFKICMPGSRDTVQGHEDIL